MEEKLEVSFKKPKNNDKLLKNLDKTNAEQAQVCNGYCRKAVYALMIVGWGLMSQSNLSLHIQSSSITLPVIVIFLGVVYLVIDACIHYNVASTSRTLIKERIAGIIDGNTVKYVMNKKSDMVFILIKYKIAYCLLMMALLTIHVYLALNNTLMS